MTDQTMQNRCYWRSRRGLLELDLLLPPFVLARFASLAPAQREALFQLLDHDDHDVWDWLRGAAEARSPALAEIVRLIRAFNAEADGDVDRDRRID
jgi:antitoxin CptB